MRSRQLLHGRLGVCAFTSTSSVWSDMAIFLLVGHRRKVGTFSGTNTRAVRALTHHHGHVTQPRAGSPRFLRRSLCGWFVHTHPQTPVSSRTRVCSAVLGVLRVRAVLPTTRVTCGAVRIRAARPSANGPTGLCTDGGRAVIGSLLSYKSLPMTARNWRLQSERICVFFCAGLASTKRMKLRVVLPRSTTPWRIDRAETRFVGLEGVRATIGTRTALQSEGGTAG
jgi:hypothetical protein